MKSSIKKIFFKFSKPIFNKIGYTRKVRHSNQMIEVKNSLLNLLFENMKTMGFIPKHIVDIGANHGSWTRETLKYFPDAHFSLIEPQEWLKPSLQDLLDNNSKINFYPVGAGSKSGSFKFTIVDRDDSCSFRYSEDEAKKGGYKQVEIPIITLNEFVINNKELPFPDLVKIDAEGLDIEVLDGASELFGKTELFLVEAGVFNKNFDNSFLNVISYMDRKGYSLFEITDLNRPFKPHVLWLVELAFIKKNGIIDSNKISF